MRGTIESVDGQMLTVKGRDGAALKMKLADNAAGRAVVKASLADIKQGSFVGITGMPQPDGTQKAVEVLFSRMPCAAPVKASSWDLLPDSTMTNANRRQLGRGIDGQKLVLKYKDGEKTIIVSADTSPSSLMPRDRWRTSSPAKKSSFSPLKQDPDGTLDAPNVTVSRDGVNPPM